MKVVFVNPPSLRHDVHDLAPPLWGLLLGAVARKRGIETAIVDLNLEVLAGCVSGMTAEFYSEALPLILRHQPDFVCFSSMGLNSHVALRMGELLKRARPQAYQLVGGPHFSAIARQVLEFYPWIDGVFIGEAERSFGDFVQHLAHKRVLPASLPGVLFRETAIPKHHDNLTRQLVLPDQIPPPAYELVELSRYFSVNPRRLLDFDGARRGCKFACRYCYAPGHFGQGERKPDNSRYIAEMRIAKELGADHLFLVTDNFINYPETTMQLCDELEAAALGLTFNCYGTLPQLTPKMVESLARAGCRAIYVGVDAVAPDAMREWGKSFFRSELALASLIDCCLDFGVTPNLAFMLDEPSGNLAQFERTVEVAFGAAVKGASIVFNTLTLYPNVPLERENRRTIRACNLKARISFDSPAVVLENAYSQEQPELYPFHARHRSYDTQGRLLVLAHLLKTLSDCAGAEIMTVIRHGALLPLLERLTSGFSPEEFAQWTPRDRRLVPLQQLAEIL